MFFPERMDVVVIRIEAEKKKLRPQGAICWLGKVLPWPMYLESCA